MRIAIAAIALMFAGCFVIPDAFEVGWHPDGTLMSHAAQECRRKARPVREGESGDVAVHRQSTEIQNCLRTLPTTDLVVLIFDEPNGKAVSETSSLSPDGIPVELLSPCVICPRREREDWRRVRLESGVSGWVQGDLLTLVYLQ